MFPPYIGIRAERSDVFHYSLLSIIYSLFSILYSLLPLHRRVRDAARYRFKKDACTRAANSRPYGVMGRLFGAEGGDGVAFGGFAGREQAADQRQNNA